jgi:subfamily B ATP-binding cassette protein MsbA
MTTPKVGDKKDSAEQSSLALLARLLRNNLRPYLGRLVLAVACMGLYAGATALSAWLMQPALDDVFVRKDATMLVIIPLALVAAAVLKGFADYGQTVLTNKTGLRIVTDLQKQMFAHLMGADLAFFHNSSTGRLISRFTNDVNMLRSAVSSTLIGMGRDFMTTAFLVAVMFHRDWKLALIAVFVFPLSVMPVLNLGRQMRRVSTNTQVEIGNLATLLTQTFQGARHVKAYGMEDYEKKRADRTIEGIFKLMYKSARVRAIARPITETLGTVGAAFVIFYGGSQVIDGSTTPGAFFSFIAALIMAYQPVRSLGNLNTSLQEGLAAAQRIFDMLDIEPGIKEREDTAPLKVSGGTIRFDRVSFSYGSEQEALHELTLEVPAGRTVALVGPSGAGKSTILNLIPRFYDARSGAVSIDGVDVRDVSLASLRANIALVSQEIALFDDTVRANIAYGRAGCSEADIVTAAKRAAAHDFVVDFPQGYDTLVGEHGIKLSGGQRQRIAIARAMVKNAPILLLDEATSSLDTESERQIQVALKELMKGRTTLIIAHRLSTVIDADLIYVIDGGRVRESGTHAELMAHGALYARLYALQFADEKSDAPNQALRAEATAS